MNVVPLIRQAWASVQVIAAVLPDELVFLPEQDSGEVVELGRLPRKAILDVDVVDGSGVHVPEPISETFEPEVLSLVVLRWSKDGVEEDERFAFRSAWLAWRAARRLRAAAKRA
jgi:hypothetical protein